MRELGKQGLDVASSYTASQPLTEDKIIERLKTSQQMAVEHARPVFNEYLSTLSGSFADYAQNAKSNHERDDYFLLSHSVTDSTAELSRFFLGYLAEGFVKFKRQELVTTTGEERFQSDMLALVDNDDLEETIAISSITRRAENFFAESLWALNQRLSVLNEGRKVTDRGNPVSPIQYCESLRRALQLLNLDPKAKLIAYKAFDNQFIAQMGDLLGDINEYLIAEGILPHLRYSAAYANSPPVPLVEEMGFDDEAILSYTEPSSVAFQPEATVARGAMGGMRAGTAASATGAVQPPDPNLPSGQYQEHLLAAIKTLQGHIASFSDDGHAAGRSFGPFNTSADAVGYRGDTYYSGGASLFGTDNSLFGTGNSLFGTGNNSAISAGGSFENVDGRQALVYSSDQLVGALEGLQAQALGLTSVETIDLGPANIPGAAIYITRELRSSEGEERAVDPVDMRTIDLVGMLFEFMLSDDNLPDSVKTLLSYMHTPFLKVAFLDKSFFEQTEHPARLLLNNLAEAGVMWVGNDGSSQYEIYDKIKHVVTRVLTEFKNDVRLFAELLLDFSGYTKKISHRQELMERRAMEKVQGEEKLREVKIQVNQEVRSRTDGRELPSAVLLLLLQPWSDYLAFILLRYGESSESWQRAIQAIDDVLWSIQAKDNIADKTRQLEMHDRLLETIGTGFETIGYDQVKGKKLLEALFSLQRMGLQSKQVEPAPEQMRNKLELMAAEKAGRVDPAGDHPTVDEMTMVENLKLIEFGTWFEFTGGMRLKVAWYNSKTLHYMLVDQVGKKVAMRSGLQLARALLDGGAKVIAGSAKPFFERALENIFRSLNVKAEGMSPTLEDRRVAKEDDHE